MKKLIPVSRLHAYFRHAEGRSIRDGESLLDAVAESLCRRHGIERGTVRARTFVETHRSLVFGANAPSTPPAAQRQRPAALPPEASDAFLASYEWRRVRMVALKKYGARCQCCGATPATGAVMNVDHIKPRRLFPELALDVGNLQVLCHECNHGKGNWDMTDWRASATVP